MDAGPDFFVVGAPRAGTTSLYHALDRHPQIFVPAVKEPHYYAWPEVADTYYDTSFVADAAAYLELFADRQPGQLAGDFSTSYLFRHRAASRIRADNPDARIVMVLRHPVERALSHHRMDRRDGYTLASVVDLLGPTAADPRFRREYLDVGRYADQIRAYREHFDDRQIHIILFEDLVGAPTATMRDLFDFLGIDADVDLGPFEARNHTGTSRSDLGRRLQGSPVAAHLGRRLGRRPRRLARRLLYRPDRTGPDPRDRALLAELLGQEIRELERVIGRDLSAWFESEAASEAPVEVEVEAGAGTDPEPDGAS